MGAVASGAFVDPKKTIRVMNQWERIINLGFFCIFDHVVPFTSCTLASKLFYAYHYVIRKNQLGCCRVI